MDVISSPPNPIPVGLITAIEGAGHFLTRSPLGWEVDNATAVQAIISGYAGSVAELSYWKATQLAALATKYAAVSASFTYGGNVFELDAASQQQIAAMGSLAAQVVNNTPGAAAWPTGFAWISAANVSVLMTAAQMFAFAQAAAAYVSGCIVNNRALKTSIGAATTAAAVQSIDLAQGWPASA